MHFDMLCTAMQHIFDPVLSPDSWEVCAVKYLTHKSPVYIEA